MGAHEVKPSEFEMQQNQAGELGAVDVLNKFENFQDMCVKLEDTAEELGLANSGEAGNMNCFKDAAEVEAIERATLGLSKQAKETQIAAIDEWTLAAVTASSAAFARGP